MDLGLTAYATVMAELASTSDPRGAVLARHGLDEESWAAADTYWQDRLSEAMDDDGDGVPEVLSVYAAAYEAAQRAQAPPISLEQFARITRLFQSSGDVVASLGKVGATLADYVRGSEHWSRRMTEDPDLERRFHAALAGRPETSGTSGEPS